MQIQAETQRTDSPERGKRVLLVGGTGYVGEVMREHLRRAGCQVRLLVRTPQRQAELTAEGFETALGDIDNPESLVRAMDDVDVVVNLVAIIKEKAPDVTFEKINYQGSVNVANAARQAGVKRFIQMSALGAGNLPDYPYHYTKWRAENYVKDLGLEWTIFRPSIVFGPSPSDKEQFVGQLADLVKKAPVIPVVGDGTSRFQPVHLDDVSDAFCRAVDDPATVGRTYDLGGPDQMTYEDILDEIARTLGKQKPKLHVPVGLMQFVVSLTAPVPAIAPPVTKEQLKMLSLDNTTNDNATPSLVERPLIPLYGNIDYVKS
jgi:NADH dehydrogenase